MQTQGLRLFLEMGESRSYTKVAQQMGLRVSEVMRHARKFKWSVKVEEVRARAAEINATEDGAENLAEINRRHLGNLRRGAQIAMAAIEAAEELKPNEAIRLLQMCMTLERQVTGADGKEEDLRSVLLEQIRALSAPVIEKVGKSSGAPQITAEPAEPNAEVDASFEFDLEKELLAQSDELFDGTED